MGGGEKKARRYGAAICITDETGVLMAPTRRTCLAPAGRTPVLPYRAKHREKVSAAAAVCLSPVAGHVRLYHETFPGLYVDNYLYAEFLRGLLRRVRGPVVLVQDGAPLHRGEWTADLVDDFPWLADLTYTFPPYASDRNPVEYLWGHTKGHDLVNFAPADVADADRAVDAVLRATARDQPLLRSFLPAARLPW